MEYESMKAKSRQKLYLNLSPAKKRKRAIKWCMRILHVDINCMNDDVFSDFMAEYECIVAYPENIGYYHMPMPVSPEGATDKNTAELIKIMNGQGEAARRTFKEYQEKAIALIGDFQQIGNQPGALLTLDMTMTISIRIRRNHTYSISNKEEHYFEYSYARQIARALDGKTFDDVFRKCDNCGRYFAVLSNRPKESCSHKCAMLHYNKKIFKDNPTLARKRGNLESYYSRMRKNNYTDAKTRSLLRFYIKKNNYKPEWISPSINKFLKRKSEK